MGEIPGEAKFWGYGGLSMSESVPPPIKISWPRPWRGRYLLVALQPLSEQAYTSLYTR